MVALIACRSARALVVSVRLRQRFTGQRQRSGVPTDAKNNQLTLRLQVEL